MTIAIMQPYLFPYIGYWQLIKSVDKFVIFDDVNYIKKGYINRNSILMNNTAHLFTLELIGASQNKLINEIEIGNNSKKILKSIERAYSKAPYFKDVFPLLVNILTSDEKNLAKFIGYSLEKISSYLGMNTEFIYSSNLKNDKNLKAQEKIIDICKYLNAEVYVNAIGGQELYEKDSFKFKGVTLQFLDPKIEEYQQFKNEFIPYLSVIDLLMFNDKDTLCSYLNKYSIIE